MRINTANFVRIRMWLLAVGFFFAGAGAAWFLLAAPLTEQIFRLVAASLLVGATVAVTIAINRSLRRQVRDRSAELKAELAQRRQRERDLADSEAQFHCVFDNIGEGIFLHDIATQRVVSVNRAFCQMYGCTEAQGLQMRFRQVSANVPPYTEVEAIEWMRKAREEGPQDFEWMGRRLDTGEEFWVAANLRLIRIGERDYVLGVERDISERKTAEAMLSSTLSEKDAILQNALVGIVLLRQRKIVSCNRRLEELFGYGAGEMLGLYTDVLYPSRVIFDDIGVRAYETIGRGDNFNEELLLRRKNGEVFWGALTGRAVDPQRPHDGSIWIYSDISERKRAEESLQLMARVFSNSNEAIMITDAENRIVAVNPAFVQLTGYAEAEVLGENPKLLSAGRTSREVFDDMWQSLASKGAWEGELWDRRKSGEPYPKWLSIASVRDAEGKLLNYVGSFVDITERKASEEQVRYLAHHDALTGLPNRFSLHERLEQALGFVRRAEGQLALMLVDLDRFKGINDTLGHDVGDQLLIEVARRLNTTVRSSDIVARLGGDEFVVVLPGIEAPTDAALVAQKMVASIAEPCFIKGHELRTSPSIGICLFPDDATEIGDLLKNADVAMYHAKSHGRSNYQFFTAEMQENAAHRMSVEADLRVAIDSGQFELHYQPQLDLRLGRIVGVEALVRWRHPRRGMVSPLDFIPVAEETGLIAPLGDWILAEACRQLKEWHGAGLENIRMSVNLSASQFLDAGLGHRLMAMLTAAGLPAASLDLEITESMSMESPDLAIAHMRTLRALGMSLSIDDFGTSYSSLAYLKLFPIRTLKIDRSFVKDIETDPNDADICDVTVLLAHKLGLDVVAEGVETEAQLRYLLSIGCEKIQGYLISRPLPAAAAEDFIRQHKPLAGLATVELWEESQASSARLRPLSLAR